MWPFLFGEKLWGDDYDDGVDGSKWAQVKCANLCKVHFIQGKPVRRFKMFGVWSFSENTQHVYEECTALPKQFRLWCVSQAFSMHRAFRSRTTIAFLIASWCVDIVQFDWEVVNSHGIFVTQCFAELVGILS